MRPLTARELMTADVVTVPPETPVMAIAQLLADRGISAVPVLGADGKLRGIVTEADLIRRMAGGHGEIGLLRQLFTDMDQLANRYAATHGATAAEIMTVDLVTVSPETHAGTIAELLEEKKIRRVVVVEEGRLCGVVSRADLLRALVAPPLEHGEYSDERLRRAVQAAIKREPWAETFFTLMEVKDGVVELHGFSRSAAVQRGLKVLIAEVPGVTGVVDKTQPMPSTLFAA
ncbi:CBS domain-containing protein [Roseomonas sp. 18066]|uniref:CBS domain-containing protein n=1 Tax=Roseomonas sp. 18066 TaxID=2681412 RepID=UPI001F231DAC|nr:CBS domain-containing protein [Roseomonas sp. 18066]